MKKYKRMIVLIILIISLMALSACKKESARDGFMAYKEAWEKKDYQEMYGMLSSESKDYISQEDFIKRYKNIYEGIKAEGINIEAREEDKEEKKDKKDMEEVDFSLRMNTLAGEVFFDSYKAIMVREKEDKEEKWKVKWDEDMIFPDMDKEDEVRISSLKAVRGEIYDRFKNPLAINGKRYSIGIHPALYDTSKTPLMAELLDVDREKIERELDKNTNPDHFVPIVKIPLEEDELIEELLEIEGVKYLEVDDRVYPGGEALGTLVGYIRPITKEELEKDEDGAYNGASLIGKAGLEQVYEKTLRANNGIEIYISKRKDKEEVERIVLAKEEPEDGKDIKVSIDSRLQKKIYEEMDGEVGATTAVDPKTGEILALVSYPSFDSNIYTTYISNSQSQEWLDTDVNVFENRFTSAYSPGSTFKIVTGAIGLESGAIDPLEKENINGKSWQKDGSWGNYEIKRVSESLTDLDLKDAFIYSDNIYFARSALKIGPKDFLEGSKKFGFGEDLPLDYPFAKSQIVSGESIEGDILLADTGYGQGQILMSPLHLSLIYGSLLNDGNIMKPYLEMGENEQAEIWKENVVSETTREILLNDLISVIEDPNGTGFDARIEGVKLAGKTGTAELKTSQEGRGKENGWFVVMDADKADIVIAAMVENVEDKGGSHYVVPKVREIMVDYLKDK